MIAKISRRIFGLCQNIRYAILSPLFRLLISDAIWSQSTLDFFNSLILDEESSTSQKEDLILASTRPFLRPLLRMYLSICRYKNYDFHVDIPKYIVLHVHKFVGLLDPTLHSKIDDLVYAFYDPLRDYMAYRILGEDWGDAQGLTITTFRFAPAYSTVADISQHAFAGFTRSFDINSRADFSILYYDVLLQSPRAVADHSTIEKIREGKINAIAVSYRHKKNHREKLGIGKNELMNALRALHEEALPAGPSTQYSLWWDSVLKCSKQSHSDQVKNWAAVGICAYGFCHVLSIRREAEEEEIRLWISLERALGSLRAGMTAVNVGPAAAEVAGAVPAKLCDAEWALSEGFKYALSGDLYDADVTFEHDKKLLNAAGLMLLCVPGGLGVLRGLVGNNNNTVTEVKSLASLEDLLFLTTMTVRLGSRTTFEGEGEAYLDMEIELLAFTDIGDRRNWLPNSIIYDLVVWTDELPRHVEQQTVAVIRRYDDQGDYSTFGLQLYYQHETPFNCEAIHGCVTKMSVKGTLWKVTGVSRLHIPTASGHLEGFKNLEIMCRENAGNQIELTDDVHVKSSLDWIWHEQDINGKLSHASIFCLPQGKTKLSVKEERDVLSFSEHPTSLQTYDSWQELGLR